MTARLFFIAVFGSTSAANALSALVAVSALGNILSVVIGTSRVIRECGRYGFSFHSTTSQPLIPPSDGCSKTRGYSLPGVLGINKALQHPAWPVPAQIRSHGDCDYCASCR